MVTVRDIWQEALPAGTELLAGRTGLQRAVGDVVAMKPVPPGLTAPRRDDLVLLSTRILRTLDPQLTVRRAVRSLTSVVAAAVIEGQVPADASEEAERAGFPLLRLPDGTSPAEVERDIVRVLAGHQQFTLERRAAMLRELTDLAVHGLGIDALTARMSEMAGAAVLCEDEHGVISLAIPAQCAVEESDILRTESEGALQRVTTPVRGRGIRGVSLSVVGPISQSGPDVHLLLEAGATAAAIDLAREQAVRETIHRIEGDLVHRLLHGEGDEEALRREAARLGYDLDGWWVSMALRPEEGADLSLLRRRVGRVLTGQGFLGANEVGTLVLFHGLDAEGATGTAWRLAERLVRDMGSVGQGVRVGMSRAFRGVSGFQGAGTEARQAVHLGAVLRPERGVVAFEDLGVYRLLLAIPDRADMTRFYEDLLGELARSDRLRGGMLIQTLDAYLQSGSVTEVAARLTLHRNTVIYRLRRIREITGLDLNDAEARFALQMALRVGATLEAAAALGL